MANPLEVIDAEWISLCEQEPGAFVVATSRGELRSAREIGQLIAYLDDEVPDWLEHPESYALAWIHGQDARESPDSDDPQVQ